MGSIYMGVKKVIIIMYVMSSFNHYMLILHSHEVITVLQHLQIFLCPTNRSLTRVSFFDSFTDGTSEH
jgi:hypothetical protein